MNKLIGKITKAPSGTWLRTVLLFAALINQAVITFGVIAIPILHSKVYSVISVAATIVVSLWCWWKNNSFSAAAIRADGVKTEIRREKI